MKAETAVQVHTRRRALPKALVILFISALILLGVEGGLRLFMWGRTVAPPIYTKIADPPGYELKPDAGCDCLQKGRFVHTTIDGEGHRLVPNQSADPAAKEVHLVGDSQVFGEGLSDNETLAFQLQARLGNEFKVINHGVPGYGPFAYVRVLQSIPQDSWVVVVQTEANDLLNSYTSVTATTVRCGYLAPDTFWGNNLPCWLLNMRSFQISSALLGRLTGGKRAVPTAYDSHAKVASEVLMYRNQELLRKHREMRGNRLIFTFVPWVGFIDHSRLQTYLPTIKDPRPAVQFPDDCRILDYFHQSPHPETLFLPYDDHLSPEGAYLFSGAIAKTLQERVISR
jgi:hypothetical protein